VEDALDRFVRAFARAAAGAVCDGDELRRERLEPFHRAPKRFFHLRSFRREEFEGDVEGNGEAEGHLYRRQKAEGRRQIGTTKQQCETKNARGDEAARASALAGCLTWPQFASKSPRDRFSTSSLYPDERMESRGGRRAVQPLSCRSTIK